MNLYVIKMTIKCGMFGRIAIRGSNNYEPYKRGVQKCNGH